jgi:hypothetical protein
MRLVSATVCFTKNRIRRSHFSAGIRASRTVIFETLNAVQVLSSTEFVFFMRSCLRTCKVELWYVAVLCALLRGSHGGQGKVRSRRAYWQCLPADLDILSSTSNSNNMISGCSRCRDVRCGCAPNTAASGTKPNGNLGGNRGPGVLMSCASHLSHAILDITRHMPARLAARLPVTSGLLHGQASDNGS